MKKYSHLWHNIILILLLSLYSCKKEGLFNAGETVSREVPLADIINNIEIQAMFDITLVQDTINKAIVVCGENLQHNIDIYIKDEILYLQSSVKYNWSRSYKKVELELHLISIPAINVRNPVYITTRDTFKTNEFYLIDWEQFTELDITLDVNNCAIAVSSENFGHYTIKGKAKSATFNDWGSAFIDAKGMQVKNCIVSQKSIGDVYVYVTDELRVSFKSTGRVFYYGDPKIIVEEQSSNTKLIRLTQK
ncbi:MAG: hypothetical protein EHM93_04385 [Bacteroidales bacterium]|nr:MAG: hypothetical protein EHM93_04385 [Bacteroidales bacterium]